MVYVIETPNPFEPLKLIKHELSEGLSIRQWVTEQHPEGDFPVPTICIVNGDAMMRAGWDYRMKDRDVINFITLPHCVIVILLIIAIVIALASVVVSLLMSTPAPGAAGDGPASDPVFTVKGQSNSIRLGEPIECPYGRNRVFPSYASRPYYEYRDNDQFQFSLFCIGQGDYDIDEILIGDTALASFQEVEYEIIPPAGQVTLFPTNVYTSAAAGGQKLFATNEPDYPVDGWVGPFVVNPANTEGTELAIDLVFPKGLYKISSKGNLKPKTILVQVQSRLIDNAGNPAGPWESLFANKKVEVYEATPRSLLWRTKPHSKWVWTHVSTTVVGLDSDDTVASVTTVYSDAGGDNPRGRPGVTKTVTTVTSDSDYITITGKTTTPQRKSYRSTVTPGRYEVRMRRVDEFDDSYKVGHEVEWGGMRTYLTADPIFGAVTLLAVIIRATNNLNVNSSKQINVICTRKLPILESGVWSEPTATRSPVWAFVDIFKNVYGAQIDDDVFFDWDELEVLDALYASRQDYFDFVFRDPITVWESARVVARVGRAVPMLVGSLISMRRDAAASVPVTMFTPENIIKDSFDWSVKLWDLGEFDCITMEYTDPDTGYKQEQVTATLPGGTTDRPQDVRFLGCQSRTRAYREALYLLAVDKYLRDNITFETGLEGHLPTYGDLIAFAHDVPQWGQAGYVVHGERGEGDWYHLHVSEPLSFAETGDYQIALRGRAGEVLGPFTAYETASAKQVAIQTEDTGMDFMMGGQSEPMLFVFGTVSQMTRYWKVVRIEPTGGEKVRVTAVNTNDLVYSFDALVPPVLNTPPTPPQAPDLPEVTEVTVTPIGDDEFHVVQISWPAAFGAQYYVVQTSEDEVHWTERALITQSSVQLQVRPGELWVRVAGVNLGQGPWEQAALVVSTAPGNPSAVLSSADSDQIFYTLSWTVPEDDTLIRVVVWLSDVNEFDPDVEAPVLDEILSAAGWEGIPTSYVVSVPIDSFGGHAIQYWRVALFSVGEDDITTNITPQQSIPLYSV